jgi:hypothetical protein
MKVKDLFLVLSKTNFKSFYINNPEDNRVPKLSADTINELLEVQEFTLEDFGSWVYGSSNYGKHKERFKFIIQFMDDGEMATKVKYKNSLEDVWKDETILGMEVVEIKTLSLEGNFNVSTTNTAWPSNDASMEIIVSNSK